MNLYFTINFKYFSITVALIAYLLIGYCIKRENFYILLGLFSLLFIIYLYFIKYFNNSTQLFKIGLLFRIILIFSAPNLSQDFYRFIWDGHIILNGYNPYTNKPQLLIDIVNFPNATFLYEKMGSLSQSNYSNYPPINQLFFVIAAFIGGKSYYISMLVLKLFVIFADIGIYHFGTKILLYLNKNKNLIFIYFLNPLVIIELSANLHFEGVMLFFFILGIYFFTINHWVKSAVFIALSIATKLLPLILLPLFFRYLGFKKAVWFYSSIIGICIVLFLPFLNQGFLYNFTNTIALWFVNFEFNASIYYLIREIGYQIKGYNIIQSVGKITPIVTVLIILGFAFLRKNKDLIQLLTNALLFLSIYFFISTTVHPWYIISLVLLSVFTNFKYPIVWSFLIIFSYYAYSLPVFKENFVLILFSYMVIYLFLFYELFIIKKDS